MSRHTSGPWQAHGLHDYETATLTIETEQGDVVAEINNAEGPCTDRERADARAIAVTPQLLSVCKAMWLNKDATDQEGLRRLYALWLDMRDCLLKAEVL